MNEYLFSYGTLQKEKVQLELFGRPLGGASDSLRGYKTRPVEIDDASFLSKGEQRQQLTLAISHNSTDVVEGTAFQVSPKELLLADEYEPDGYKRTAVVLQSGKRAWVYLAKKD